MLFSEKLQAHFSTGVFHFFLIVRIVLNCEKKKNILNESNYWVILSIKTQRNCYCGIISKKAQEDWVLVQHLLKSKVKYNSILSHIQTICDD